MRNFEVHNNNQKHIRYLPFLIYFYTFPVTAQYSMMRLYTYTAVLLSSLLLAATIAPINAQMELVYNDGDASCSKNNVYGLSLSSFSINCRGDDATCDLEDNAEVDVAAMCKSILLMMYCIKPCKAIRNLDLTPFHPISRMII